MAIYDAEGRFITQLADRAFDAGDVALAWHGLDARGRRAGSGIYFVRLSTETGSLSRKMVLAK